jgi:transcriptional regulator with XRE-family HTH domain
MLTTVYSSIPISYAAPVATFGSNIKKLRESAQLTQDALAGLCRVGQGEISKWENDSQEPTAQSLLKLAVGLGVTIDLFFDDVNAEYAAQRQRAGALPALILTPKLEERLRIDGALREIEVFLSMPEDLREWLLQSPYAPREVSRARESSSGEPH